MKYEVALNGKIYEVDVTKTDAVLTSVKNASFAPAPSAPAAAPVMQNAPAAQTQTATGEKIIAPMPGNILSVNITVGQSIKAGDVLFVLEAMKMENEILAPADGKIASVNVTKGATVESGAVLCTIA